jgi:hypothetical protein
MSLAIALRSPHTFAPSRSWSIPSTLRRPKSRLSTPYLITADFEAPDGERLYAVGGGPTLDEAIAAARDGLSLGADWEVVRWNHVHGE